MQYEIEEEHDSFKLDRLYLVLEYRYNFVAVPAWKTIFEIILN